MDKTPPICWNDIAGLDFVKKTIKEIVIWPMLRPFVKILTFKLNILFKFRIITASEASAILSLNKISNCMVLYQRNNKEFLINC